MSRLERVEDENKSLVLFFWGSLHNICVDVSVCEHLQDVCVGAHVHPFLCVYLT